MTRDFHRFAALLHDYGHMLDAVRATLGAQFAYPFQDDTMLREFVSAVMTRYFNHYGLHDLSKDLEYARSLIEPLYQTRMLAALPSTNSFTDDVRTVRGFLELSVPEQDMLLENYPEQVQVFVVIAREEFLPRVQTV